MKLLKKGTVVEKWIGECSVCGCVVCATTDELNAKETTEAPNNMKIMDCIMCNEGEILFCLINSTNARSIFRRNSILLEQCDES